MSKNFTWIGRSIVLGTLLAGSFCVGGAIADPDPIFRPILRELKENTPSGWTVRLPSKLGLYATSRERLKVHPELGIKNGKIIIGFSQKLGCDIQACRTGSYIGIDREDRPYHQFTEFPGMSDNTENVILNSGVTAQYLSNCNSPDQLIERRRRQAVQWKQNGMNYWIVQYCSRKEDIIETASSMSMENSVIVGSSGDHSSRHGSSDLGKQTIESLPDGDYRYKGAVNRDEIIRFRKTGKMISAWQGSLTELTACLVGEVKGNSIIRGFEYVQGYGKRSKFEYLKKPVDLSSFTPLTLQDAETSNNVTGNHIRKQLQYKVLRGCETKIDVLTDRFTAAYGTTAAVEAQVDTPKSCNINTWITFPERATNRPQSRATADLMKLVCTAPSSNPGIGIGVVFNPPSRIRKSPNGPIICTLKDLTAIALAGGVINDGWVRTMACGGGVIHQSQLRYD